VTGVAAGPPVLSVAGLHVRYTTQAEETPVLNGVDFEIGRGETLGLVGETGSGKSILIMAAVGLLDKNARTTAGEVVFEGRDLLALDEAELQRIRGREIAMIMQNPRSALDALTTVGDQIAAVYAAHTDASRKEARARALEMIRRVRLPDAERVAETRPHELSGGMAQRISIAMALACSPKLLLADDPTSGLDVTVQAQVLDLLADLAAGGGLSTLLVTRDLGIVAHYCDAVAVIYGGRIVEYADVRTFFTDARHPYSISLIGAVSYDREKVRRSTTGAARADSRNLPPGCHFHPRCPLARDNCRQDVPAFEPIGSRHFVRCHYWRDTKELLRDDAA
jgi:oligopeptide/dipeptide ABC transporter ATP-binding protein